MFAPNAMLRYTVRRSRGINRDEVLVPLRAMSAYDVQQIVVLFAGRLVAQKGVQILVQVAERLCAANNHGDEGAFHRLLMLPVVTFLVAGGGVLEPLLRDSSATCLQFIGSVDRSDMSGLLAAR